MHLPVRGSPWLSLMLETAENSWRKELPCDSNCLKILKTKKRKLHTLKSFLHPAHLQICWKVTSWCLSFFFSFFFYENELLDVDPLFIIFLTPDWWLKRELHRHPTSFSSDICEVPTSRRRDIIAYISSPILKIVNRVTSLSSRCSWGITFPL